MTDIALSDLVFVVVLQVVRIVVFFGLVLYIGLHSFYGRKSVSIIRLF